MARELIKVRLVPASGYFDVQWVSWPFVISFSLLCIMTIFVVYQRMKMSRKAALREAIVEAGREREKNEHKKWIQDAAASTAVKAPEIAKPPREASPEEMARAREQGTEIFSQVTSIRSLEARKKAAEESRARQPDIDPSVVHALESKIFDTRTASITEVSSEEGTAGKFSKLSIGGELIFDPEDLKEPRH